MKQKWQIFLFVCSALILLICSSMQADFPVLKGPYLGQKPPGMTPEVFAPGTISTDAAEGCLSFSKDGRLLLFVRGRSEQDGIFIMEQVNEVWSKPKLAPFSAGKYDWDFMLAPDSRTVFVSSCRPLRDSTSPEQNYRIWVSELTNGNWSKSQLLPFPINSGEHDSYPSVSEDGTLYFFSNRKGGSGKGDIYRSRKINETYPVVENLGVPINSKYHEVDPFIAPDESYLIFCSEKPGGFGKADFYVSFQKESGSWTEPVNMGEKINTPYSEYIPYVSPDGKYFFFTTNKPGNRDIYWVDAKIIEEFKPGKK